MSTDREQRSIQKRMLMLAITCLKDQKLGAEMVARMKLEMNEEDVALVERFFAEK